MRFVILVLAGVAMLAGACTIAARAVVAGGNGLIAFTATVNGNRDIAVLEPCGSVRALIAGPAAELKPAWSPDGRKLAFMSDRAGSFDIYAAKADGSDVRRLTDDPSKDFNPSWSPDGRRLAWNSDRSGDFEIWLPDPAVRAEREPARFRLFLVRKRTALKNRVHAILFQHGLQAPVENLVGAGGRRFLTRCALPEPWRSTVAASLHLIDTLEEQIEAIERELHRLGGEHQYLRLLMTAPGVKAHHA